MPDYPRGREILDRISAGGAHRRAFALANPRAARQRCTGCGLEHDEANRTRAWRKEDVETGPFERSADFVAPSQANGCAMACAYCYVARRKGAANPITTFVNIEEITNAILRHVNRQGWKFEPRRRTRRTGCMNFGTNSDCAADALVSNNLRDLVALFRTLPTAKATFATKYVNRELLSYDPQGKTRLRFSLMPPDLARMIDVRTSPVAGARRGNQRFRRRGLRGECELCPRDRL